jgi:hypothetical protein
MKKSGGGIGRRSRESQRGIYESYRFESCPDYNREARCG